MKTYISFGSDHHHTIDGVDIGGIRSILCIDGVESEHQGRAIAHALIGAAWCGSYTDDTYPRESFAGHVIHTIIMMPIGETPVVEMMGWQALNLKTTSLYVS